MDCLPYNVQCSPGSARRFIDQAALVVAAGYISVHMTQSALLYIQKSYDFIKVGNVQFVPTYGRPPEFSEGLHETLVALSQTIYWANYLFLACGGPEPRATAGLEKEFREELPVGGIASILLLIKLIFSDSKRIRFSLRSALTMWTHGILLVRDAIVLLGILPTDGECCVRTLGCYSRNLTLPA